METGKSFDPYVKDHWLQWDSPDVTLTRKQERWKPLIVPELILLHYGVSNSLSSLVGAQRATGYMAQLTIDGFVGGQRGTVYQVHQMYPFNMYGSHAGTSSWHGRPSVNGFSIGVEIANPGPLIRCKDGQLRTDANAKAFFQGKTGAPTWPEDQAIQAIHKRGRIIQPWGEWDHWAIYTDQEIDILIGVCFALVKAYPTITALAGHDDVAPGRKSDPGPAMPTEYLRDKLRLAA